MKVYVDKLPNACDECPCCNNDVDYGACCNLGAYDYVECHQTIYKHSKCPLKSLTKERKTLINEIKFQARVKGIFGQNGKSMSYYEFNEILDQVERGEI